MAQPLLYRIEVVNSDVAGRPEPREIAKAIGELRDDQVGGHRDRGEPDVEAKENIDNKEENLRF